VPRSMQTISIAEHQEAFARALLWREDALPAAIVGPGAGTPEKRFGVYRNNVFASLTGCLAARFPVVARLVGEEFFNAVARVFVERHPPTSPALFEYGDEFPLFLASFGPTKSLPYLPDVARLEWHVATAYHAADAQPIDATALGRLGNGAPDTALVLHPSCAIVLSHYPVFSIWQTNTRDDVVEYVDASASGEGALIVRPQFNVEVIGLDTASYAFIAALAAGHALELAAEIANELDSLFDVGAALQTLFSSGAIVGVRPASGVAPSITTNKRLLSCAN
jgi:hypothetical protein